MTKEDLELITELRGLIKDQQVVLQNHNAAFKYNTIILDKIKADLHFITELVYKEKSFTEDVKLRLNKILNWTKSKTG